MTGPKQGFKQPQAAADLVKDIIKQKVDDVKQAKADAEKARRKKRSRGPLALALLPVLLILTAWNVFRVGHPPEILSHAERVASLKFKIYIAAEAVEAYRGTHGAIPPNLTVVGAEWNGLHYVPGDTTWSIVGAVDSLVITYHDGESLTPYATAYQALQRRKK